MSHSETIELAVEQFLAHKRALGRKYHTEEEELRLLVRYAADHAALRLDDLTPVLLDGFLRSRPRARPRSFNALLGVLARLLDWAVSQQLLASSPLRARRRRATSARIPFCLIRSRHDACLTRPARWRTTLTRPTEERPIGRCLRCATG